MALGSLLFAVLVSVDIMTEVKGTDSWAGPAIGDVMLKNVNDIQGYQEVLVYFSNGTVGPSWGGICGTTSDNYDGTVVCRQLGYAGGSAKTASSPAVSQTVWFNYLECGDNPDYWHALRCKYTVANQTNPCGTNDERLLVKCIQQLITEKPYDGQVYLCPPDETEFDSRNRSISFGLIGIFLKREWRGLNQPVGNADLRKNAGDALCRQLGYTDAISTSAITSNAAKQLNFTFNNCYDVDPKNPLPIQKKAWFTTETLDDCNGNSNADCFGCCYNYPSSSSDGCTNCVYRNDLVIRCTFDYTKSDSYDMSGWPTEQCKFSEGYIMSKCLGVCSAEVDERIRDLEISIPVTAILSIVITIIIVLIIIIIKVVKVGRRHINGYTPIDDNQNVQPEQVDIQQDNNENDENNAPQ